MEKRLHAKLGALARQESGFTLIELLVTTSMMALILGAILSISDTTAKVAPRDQEWAFTLRDAQTGLQGMTRELRPAHVLHGATATSIDADVQRNGTSTRVVYDCNQPHPTHPTLKQCMRWVVTGGVPGTKVTIIPRVKSASFTYEPPAPAAPKFVRIKLLIPAAGERGDGHDHNILLDSGIYLRNLDVG